MTHEEAEEFLDSERSSDFTSIEWETLHAHAQTCALCFPDMVQAEVDGDEISRKLIDKVSEEEWRRMFEEAGQPPEIIEKALKEIREAKQKRAQ